MKRLFYTDQPRSWAVILKNLTMLSGTLFFLSLTLLVGFHLGASSVEGKPNKQPFVFWGDNLGMKANGEVWELRSSCWNRRTEIDSPVPVSDIAIWDGEELVTKSGDGWYNAGVWQNCGQVPN